MASLLILGIDKKSIKKLTLLLIKEVILYVIKDKLMKEFRRQKLDIKYQEEIKRWFIYLDQLKFGKKLEKLMLKEVDRFMANKKSIEELLEEIFEEPEWVIEIEEGLIEKYPELSTKNILLGYA